MARYRAQGARDSIGTGVDDPLVFVLLPRHAADDFKAAPDGRVPDRVLTPGSLPRHERRPTPSAPRSGGIWSTNRAKGKKGAKGAACTDGLLRKGGILNTGTQRHSDKHGKPLCLRASVSPCSSPAAAPPFSALSAGASL